MNNVTTNAPLQEILAILESITAALRTDELDHGHRLLDQALALLRTRPLDSCDRMTVQIVLGRIRRAGGRSLAEAVEFCLSPS